MQPGLRGDYGGRSRRSSEAAMMQPVTGEVNGLLRVQNEPIGLFIITRRRTQKHRHHILSPLIDGDQSIDTVHFRLTCTGNITIRVELHRSFVVAPRQITAFGITARSRDCFSPSEATDASGVQSLRALESATQFTLSPSPRSQYPDVCG